MLFGLCLFSAVDLSSLFPPVTLFNCLLLLCLLRLSKVPFILDSYARQIISGIVKAAKICRIYENVIFMLTVSSIFTPADSVKYI